MRVIDYMNRLLDFEMYQTFCVSPLHRYCAHGILMCSICMHKFTFSDNAKLALDTTVNPDLGTPTCGLRKRGYLRSFVAHSPSSN